MTVLGWAVYFGYHSQAEEAIKLLLNHNECDPFLPMRAGFFRSKTAREIAEYYERKSLIQLIEACEKSKDVSMRLAGEIQKKQMEDEQPTHPPTSNIRQRRESRFLPSGSRSTLVSTGNNQRGTTRLPSGTQPGDSLFPSPRSTTISSASTPEHVDMDPFTRREKEKQIIEFLDKADVPIDDQVNVAATLLRAGLVDVESIKGADSSIFERLKIKPAVVFKIVQASSSTTPAQAESVTLRTPKTTVVASKPIATAATSSSASENAVVNNNKPMEKTETFVPREQRQLAVDALAEPQPKKAPSPLAVSDHFELTHDDPNLSQHLDNSVASHQEVTKATPSSQSSINLTLPPGKRFHIFLSYNFGPHQIYRARAQLLKRCLESKGCLVWTTEERVEDDVLEAIDLGLNQSRVFIACITNAYVHKINAMRHTHACADWYALEYNQALVGMAPKRIIPVVFEQSMLDPLKFTGEFASIRASFKRELQLISDVDYETAAETIMRFSLRE